ncbi:unnamed protein product [Prorocentrum cordatum]|uniref:Uncharacterized protein n=1 Tax=Prorocentrum cordatum TaxID=2364126 RepID=A0ABN9QPG6_9DINO|nr:unnamed protein product [Polarella glacialis]
MGSGASRCPSWCPLFVRRGRGGREALALRAEDPMTPHAPSTARARAGRGEAWQGAEEQAAAPEKALRRAARSQERAERTSGPATFHEWAATAAAPTGEQSEHAARYPPQ